MGPDAIVVICRQDKVRDGRRRIFLMEKARALTKERKMAWDAEHHIALVGGCSRW